MEKIPFTKMNYLLINSKRKVWDVSYGLKISFYEYVKSQMHYPLMPYVHSRNLNYYKEVYLHLTGEGKCDKEIIGKVIKYFYYDIYNCLKNTNQAGEDFELDFSSVESLFPSVSLNDNLDLNQKILELYKAYQSDSVYLLWR
jgi:hypothetical protein